MCEYAYPISLAGIPLLLRCQYPSSVYEAFRTEQPAVACIRGTPDPAVISQRYALCPETETPQSTELIQLTGAVGSALLAYDRCLFHGAAFVWHGKAWIFTAPSGTGKTTQYALWKMLYGDELTILNGDKPVLQFCKDGSVLVHPSPWRGKENMGLAQSAPLGGVILLRQGPENRVRRLLSGQAALPLYSQFLFFVDKEENVDRVCALETRLLRSCPVWELTNLGDGASAQLMHDTLMRWERRRA